jgi:hypothetical protein
MLLNKTLKKRHLQPFQQQFFFLNLYHSCNTDWYWEKFHIKQMSGNNVGTVTQLELNVFSYWKFFMEFVLVTLFKQNFSAVCMHYVTKTRTEQMKYIS